MLGKCSTTEQQPWPSDEHPMKARGKREREDLKESSQPKWGMRLESSTQEAGVGGSWQIQGQPGLHREDGAMRFCVNTLNTK